MQYWRLDLAWDGRAYHGWQIQPQCLTIQQTVEEALQQLLGGHAVRVTAAGRTDAGVHALQQIVSFCSPIVRTSNQIYRGLNSLLPEDIVCLSAQQAPVGFDARHHSAEKLYRYRILPRYHRCPHRLHYVWHFRPSLQLEKMHQAAQAFVGRHDFAALRATGCSAKTTVRTILSADVSFHDDEIHLEFWGRGFLRHQVRIMVGTLVAIGVGRFKSERVSQVLSAKDRGLAGQTAPSQGLWLVKTILRSGN